MKNCTKPAGPWVSNVRVHGGIADKRNIGTCWKADEAEGPRQSWWVHPVRIYKKPGLNTFSRNLRAVETQIIQITWNFITLLLEKKKKEEILVEKGLCEMRLFLFFLSTVSKSCISHPPLEPPMLTFSITLRWNHHPGHSSFLETSLQNWSRSASSSQWVMMEEECLGNWCWPTWCLGWGGVTYGDGVIYLSWTYLTISSPTDSVCAWFVCLSTMKRMPHLQSILQERVQAKVMQPLFVSQQNQEVCWFPPAWFQPLAPSPHHCHTVVMTRHLNEQASHISHVSG